MVMTRSLFTRATAVKGSGGHSSSLGFLITSTALREIFRLEADIVHVRPPDESFGTI